MDHGRATRLLTAILLAIAIVSVVHYADNYFNYDAFPQSGTLPNPSRTLVGLSWFLFTAAGITGYLLFRRRRYVIASLLLGFYAGSGLVGFGHYAVEAMTDAVWWRQAHVIADILLGIATLSFAVWAALRLRWRLSTPLRSGEVR